MRICKVFRFDAAHYLPNYEGKCSRLHGHTWTLEVEVSSSVLFSSGSSKGMVMDFAQLKDVVNRRVIEVLDHTLVNDVVENPTCENMLFWIYHELDDSLRSAHVLVSLKRLRLYETPDSFAELRSEEMV